MLKFCLLRREFRFLEPEGYRNFKLGHRPQRFYRAPVPARPHSVKRSVKLKTTSEGAAFKEISGVQRINLATARAFPHSNVVLRLNTKYLEAALQRVTDPELLINVVSRRVRQLIQGHRPLTQTDPRMDYADVALKEISEGKIGYEIVDEEKVAKD